MKTTAFGIRVKFSIQCGWPLGRSGYLELARAYTANEVSHTKSMGRLFSDSASKCEIPEAVSDAVCQSRKANKWIVGTLDALFTSLTDA